jgi:endonuclease IV
MFGPHVDRVFSDAKGGRPSLAAHIRAARAIAAEANFDARAFQVFVAGPRNYTVTLRPEEADELRALLDEERDLFVVAHGTYLDFPWSGAPGPVKSIQRELAVCARAGLAGLVVHLGKPPLPRVVEQLPALFQAADRSGVLLYLEVPHVKPENSHYESPGGLAELFRAVRRFDPALCAFGLCIDTAHLWSCGVDLRSYKAAEDWLRRLEGEAAAIPADRILLHLNDSHNRRGSGLDHHAGLLAGQIWGEYADRPRESGLAAFVDFAVRHSIPAVLERKPPPALLEDYKALERLTAAVCLRPPPRKKGGAGRR